MSKYDSTVICDGCSLEFHWPALVEGEEKYCCADCRDGYTCNCREIALVEDNYLYAEIGAVSKYEGY